MLFRIFGVNFVLTLSSSCKRFDTFQKVLVIIDVSKTFFNFFSNPCSMGKYNQIHFELRYINLQIYWTYTEYKFVKRLFLFHQLGHETIYICE